MTFTKGLLPIGNGFISTYKENDAHINRKPIQELDHLYINNLVSGKYYNFDFGDLKFDFVPFSCLVTKIGGSEGITSLQLQVLDKNSGALVWNLPLNNMVVPVGGNQSYSYNFPFLCFSQNHLIQIIADMDLDNFIIFGEKIILNKAISPTF